MQKARLDAIILNKKNGKLVRKLRTEIRRKDNESIKRRIKSRRASIEQERSGRLYNPNKQFITKIPGFSGHYIQAPEKLSFYEVETSELNYLNTIKFIEEIQEKFCELNTVIYFRNTKRATAAALTIIYSTLETKKNSGYVKSNILYPVDSPECRRLIKSKNIHKLILNEEINFDIENLNNLPIISGVGNENFDKIIDHIQKRVFKNNFSAEKEYFYSDAVSEAINNVGRHAYPDKVIQDRRWWMACSVIDEQLYLAIYDSGVGIPKTVTKKDWFFATLRHSFPNEYKQLLQASATKNETLATLLSYLPISLVVKDHQLIYLAFMGDVSGTKLDKHGQGSKSIRTLVKETKNGKLWAFSGKGLYTLTSEGNESSGEPQNALSSLEDLEPSLHILPKSFPGTLIQWNIKLT